MTLSAAGDDPAAPSARIARRARRLARAERRGTEALAAALRAAGDALAPAEADEAARHELALVLLGAGLRERGLCHGEVVRRLAAWTGADRASALALDGAALQRALRGGPAARPQDAPARRVAWVVFLAFAVWGAVGVEVIARALP